MAIRRITISDDLWVDVREPADITARHRRAIRAVQVVAIGAMQKAEQSQGLYAELVQPVDPGDSADEAARSAYAAAVEEYGNRTIDIAKRVGMNAEDLTQLSDVQDTAVVATIVGWSLNVPVTLESLLDLPVSVYDRIVDGTKDATAAVLADLQVDFSAAPPAPGEPPSPSGA